MDVALDILAKELPDVFNHNLETVLPLYKTVRPGADYQWSLTLLKRFKENHPEILTKSGIMVGLGETYEQVQKTLRDLADHKVDMITWNKKKIGLGYRARHTSEFLIVKM